MDFSSKWNYRVDGMSEEKIPKSKRKSQIRAVTKYVKANYDRVVLNLHKGTKDRWIAEAKEHGFVENGVPNLSAFIRHCVESFIASDSGIDGSE